MKFLRYCLIVPGLCMLAPAMPAMAQDATTTGGGTYGQLSALSNQIAILKAQAQIAQLQEQIANAKRNLADSTSIPSDIPGMPAASAPASNNVYNGPRVLSISGDSRQLNAILLMPEGAKIEATRGTLLENGMMVQYISPTSVSVMENGSVFVLPFAGTTVNAPTPSPNG